MLVGPSTINSSIMSNSKNAKPDSIRAKSDICYTNIRRGLRTNFTSVKAFAMHASPQFISLSETGLDPSISNREFDIPGFHPLITKNDSVNSHGHGRGVMLKKVFHVVEIHPMKMRTLHTCAFDSPFFILPLSYSPCIDHKPMAVTF